METAPAMDSTAAVPTETRVTRSPAGEGGGGVTRSPAGEGGGELTHSPAGESGGELAHSPAGEGGAEVTRSPAGASGEGLTRSSAGESGGGVTCSPEGEGGRGVTAGTPIHEETEWSVSVMEEDGTVSELSIHLAEQPEGVTASGCANQRPGGNDNDESTAEEVGDATAKQVDESPAITRDSTHMARRLSTHSSGDSARRVSTHSSGDSARRLSTHSSGDSARRLSTHSSGDSAAEPAATNGTNSRSDSGDVGRLGPEGGSEDRGGGTVLAGSGSHESLHVRSSGTPQAGSPPVVLEVVDDDDDSAPFPQITEVFGAVTNQTLQLLHSCGTTTPRGNSTSLATTTNVDFTSEDEPKPKKKKKKKKKKREGQTPEKASAGTVPMSETAYRRLLKTSVPDGRGPERGNNSSSSDASYLRKMLSTRTLSQLDDFQIKEEVIDAGYCATVAGGTRDQVPGEEPHGVSLHGSSFSRVGPGPMLRKPPERPGTRVVIRPYPAGPTRPTAPGVLRRAMAPKSSLLVKKTATKNDFSVASTSASASAFTSSASSVTSLTKSPAVTQIISAAPILLPAGFDLQKLVREGRLKVQPANMLGAPGGGAGAGVGGLSQAVISFPGQPVSTTLTASSAATTSHQPPQQLNTMYVTLPQGSQAQGKGAGAGDQPQRVVFLPASSMASMVQPQPQPQTQTMANGQSQVIIPVSSPQGPRTVALIYHPAPAAAATVNARTPAAAAAAATALAETKSMKLAPKMSVTATASNGGDPGDGRSPRMRLLPRSKDFERFVAASPPPELQLNVKRYECDGCLDQFLTERGYNYHMERETVYISHRCSSNGGLAMSFFNDCRFTEHIFKVHKTLQPTLPSYMRKGVPIGMPEKHFFCEEYMDMRYKLFEEGGVLPKFGKYPETRQYLNVLKEEIQRKKTLAKVAAKLASKLAAEETALMAAKHAEETKLMAAEKLAKAAAEQQPRGPRTNVTPRSGGTAPSPDSSVPPSPAADPPSQVARKTHLFCSECHRDFTNRVTLNNHLQLNEDVLECDQCSVAVTSSCAFAAHRRIHSKERPFVCPECGAIISGERHVFLKHLKQRCFHFSRRLTFSCPRCLRQHDKLLQWQKHVRYHAEVYYKCLICPMAFKDEITFQSHNGKTHKSAAAFKVIAKCPFCDTVFNNLENLVQHCSKHTSQAVTDFRFQCVTCQAKPFKRKEELVNHMAAVHDVTSFGNEMCNVCGKDFLRRNSLTKHMRKVHADVWREETMPRVKRPPPPAAMPPPWRRAQVVKAQELEGPDDDGRDDLPAMSGDEETPVDPADNKDPGERPGPKDLVCPKCQMVLDTAAQFDRHMNKHRFVEKKRAAGKPLVPPLKIKILKPLPRDVDEEEEEPVTRDERPPIKAKVAMKVDRGSPRGTFTHQFPGAPEPEPMFPCPECELRFFEEVDLNDHLQASHERAPLLPCHLCGGMYDSRASLERHMKEHSGKTRDRPYVCWVCQQQGEKRGFQQRGPLTKHLLTTHKLTRHQITHCQFPFKDPATFAAAAPAGGDSATALQQPKTEVSSNNSLDDTKDALHQVEGAPRSDGTAGSLKRRRSDSVKSDGTVSSTETVSPLKRLHVAGETAYACAKCSFSTEDRGEFQRHVARHVNKAAPDCIQCLECGLSFAVLASLKKHLIVVHKVRDFSAYQSPPPKRTQTQRPRSADSPSPLKSGGKMRVNGTAGQDGFQSTPHEPESGVASPGRTKASAAAVLEQCNVCYNSFQGGAALRTHMRTHGMAFIRSKKVVT